jgi:putative transposase
MKRAYKYRFYPTPDQVELLAQTFGCVRFVYNSILRWRTDAYYERQKKVGYTQANAKLTALKKESEFTWLNDVSSVPLGGRLENGIYGHSRFCNTDFDDKLACLNLSGV